MKKIIAVFIGLMFLMSTAFAASEQAEAKSMSTVDLRLKQVGQAFSDFGFKVKSALTFNDESRLELLKERNEALNIRQQTWVDVKQDAMASFNGNMTSKQKQSVLAILKAEHESLVEDRLELTSEIKQVQLDAKAENNAELEADANAAAAPMEHGLLGIFVDLDLSSEFESDAEFSTKVESEAEAKAVVESKLGLEGDEVQTVAKSGTTFYVVSGHETETSGDFTLTKSFDVWVDANSGLIMAADMNVRIDSTSTIQANASKTISKPRGILEIGISSDSDVEGSASASGRTSTSSGSAGASANSQSSASVTSGASGSSGSGTGASAEASGSVGVSIN